VGLGLEAGCPVKSQSWSDLIDATVALKTVKTFVFTMTLGLKQMSENLTPKQSGSLLVCQLLVA
jgi:hypothetical protein